jgi:uracil-DNA glycosylase
MSETDFYDPKKVAIVPTGFCYPGKGERGDLPPRPECQVRWLDSILFHLKNLELTVLIGKYAIETFRPGGNLEHHIRNCEESVICLPHPSPLNNIWLAKNRWFEEEIVPRTQRKIRKTLI